MTEHVTDTLRDRIVQVQAEHVEGQLTNYDADGREECGCGHQGNATYREHLADAILATPGIAVVELPAKITTADELDALPFLTVIREIRPRRGIDYGGIYERRTSGWQCIAGTWVEPERNGGPTLPVMVLWRGKDER